MKRLMIPVFVLIASLAATSAQASAVALPCNACTSAEASQVARDAGPGIHHVYDFLNETLRKYEVKIEHDPETGRAHVRTPVNNSHLVCRLLLGKKKPNNTNEVNTR